MTPEQLDEIEKLAAAATPGPWDADVGVDFDDGCPIIEWYACGPAQESLEFDDDGLPSLGAAKGLAAKDAAFIVAMREYALPLVKALREARAEVERLKVGRDYDAKVIPDLMRELEEAKLLLSVKIGTVEAQRQLLADNGALLIESKAEVERLKEEVRVAWAQKADSDVWRNRYRCELKNAEAEVERLRKLLNPEPKPDIRETLMRLMREDQRKAIYAQAWEEAILAGNTREQAHSIAADAAEAALKEGDR